MKEIKTNVMRALLFLFLLVLVVVPATAFHTEKPVVRLILDTDIGPDYDDAGAIAIFHAFADRGEMIPLAILASNKNAYVAPVINLLNTFFGRPFLPIGAPKGEAPNLGAFQHWPGMILKKYPHSIKSTAEVPNAVAIYRKILARQPNHSVTIVSIGFLSNLAGLLQSKPDHYSLLSGKELIKIKVKTLVSMAGSFPGGREFNLYTDSLAAAAVFSNWPGKVVFSGFEIGKEIKTGPGLVHDSALHSPVKDIFAFCMPLSSEDEHGRMSWDETAVLVAVRGASPYFSLKRGHITIKGGSNTWLDDPQGNQYYLKQAMEPAAVAAVLEGLMRHRR